MNYFELFEIPVSLQVDKDLVRKKYFELSKKYHPDYFVNTTFEEQQNALDVSALLNKGLKTFSNPDETLCYVLKLKGVLDEEEKYQLAPDFLMDMMEINEELADADAHSAGPIAQKLEALEKDIYEPVQSAIENYKEGVTSQEALLQVKDYYFKKKYLQRLHQQLNRKL